MARALMAASTYLLMEAVEKQPACAAAINSSGFVPG